MELLTHSDAKRSSDRLQMIAYIIIFYLASILMAGYKVYYHNQALQIPLVNLLNDHSLYPHDPFAMTLPYYASIMWHAVAFGSRVLGLEPLMLILFLIEKLLLIISAAYLAQTFSPKSKLASVGAMAFFALGPLPLLGGGTIVMPYFEQTAFSMPLFMFAMALFYRSKRIWWAVLMAVAFNCTGMYGTYALTYFMAAFLLDGSYRKEWKKWIPAFLIYIIMIIPALILTESAFKIPSTDKNLWAAAALVRLPHHLFPLTWNPKYFVKFAIVLILAIIIPIMGRQKSEKLIIHSKIWALISCGWIGYAFLAAHLKSPAMLVMHPARATDLWYCFAMTSIIALCGAAAENDKKLPAFAAFFASVLFWYAKADFLYLLLIAVVVFSLFKCDRFKNCCSSDYLAPVLAGGILIVSCCFLAYRAEAKGGILRGLVWRQPQSAQQIADWARENTSKDSVFLINLNWGMFRAVAKRPVYVTWKDGSALLWYRPFVKDWAQRLNDVGYDITKKTPPGKMISAQLDVLYDGLTDSEVNVLKSKYSLRYWVVKLGHKTSFPVVFKNQYFEVLDLKKP